MAARSRLIPPSLWLAIALLAFVLIGGPISGAIQARRAQDKARAAAFDMTGGDARRGKGLFISAGCGACHEIKGVDRADGTVGPPLDKVATRAFIAGRLANNPANLTQWIQHPQAIEPGNGMPDPAVSDQQARDLAAYLYTLK